MHPLLKTIAKEIVVQNNSGSGKITIGSSNFVQVRNDKRLENYFSVWKPYHFIRDDMVRVELNFVNTHNFFNHSSRKF